MCSSTTPSRLSRWRPTPPTNADVARFHALLLFLLRGAFRLQNNAHLKSTSPLGSQKIQDPIKPLMYFLVLARQPTQSKLIFFKLLKQQLAKAACVLPLPGAHQMGAVISFATTDLSPPISHRFAMDVTWSHCEYLGLQSRRR